MTVSTGVVSRVPLVDLSGPLEPGPRRDDVVAEIRRAREDVGFLVITGHGVSSDAVQQIDDAARRFFSLPVADKMELGCEVGNRRGYKCIPTCTSPDDPPRHEPITSGEWLDWMIRKTTTYD